MQLQIPCLLLMVALYYHQVADCKMNQTLHILGLYPNSGDGWTEPYVVHSTQLALNHIHANESILSDYEIVIDWKDTQCDGGTALKEFIDALALNRSNNSHNYLAVFGGGCAVATSEVAAISFRYGLAQIAYASTAPNLGNEVLYPKFVRGVPSDLNAVPARAAFINQKNWKRVAIINQQDPIFVASSHSMETVLDTINVEYRVEDFAPDGTIPLDQQVRTISDNLRGNGYRIIIANMYEDAAIKILCELHKQKETLLLPNIATWIFLGWFTDQWHNKPDVLDSVGCTAEQIAKISNGALGFLVAHSKSNFKGETDSPRPTVVNDSTAELYQAYRDITLTAIKDDISQFNRESDVHEAYGYDSMWTLALSLQQVLENGTNLTQISKTPILQRNISSPQYMKFCGELYSAMRSQEFIGWGGKVEYVGHERFYDQVQILEFVNGSLLYRGDCENIPYYDNYTVDTIGSIRCDSVEKFMYWNKDTATDGITDTLVHPAIISITIILSVFITVYVTFLIVVILVGKFKHLKSIKNSSPILTCIILAGNYLLVLAGVFYISNDRIVGHDNPALVSNFTGEEQTTEVCDAAECKFLCMFPICLLLVASSLIFGGMIGKASMIYLSAVKLRFDLNEIKKNIVRFCWPIIFTCVDVVYILIWSLASSLVMKSEVQATGIDSDPYIRIIQYGISLDYEAASTAFIVLLILYKAAIVLTGLVMAYNLRNVKKENLRYSGTITWTMYNVTIFTLVLILSLFLIDNYVIKRAVLAALVLVTAIITASITGLPPVYYMFREPHTGETAIADATLRQIPEDLTMLNTRIEGLLNDKRELESENKELVTNKGKLESENKEQVTNKEKLESKIEEQCKIIKKLESDIEDWKNTVI